MPTKSKTRAKPAPKASRDPIATRAALLEAAREQFNAVGYFGTDTNRIARRAGFAPGTFYKHFADKKAVFMEVYQEWHREQRKLISGLTLQENDPHAYCAKLARGFLPFYTEWRGFRASVRALAATETDVQEFRHQRREDLVAFAQQARRVFGKPPGPTAEALTMILALERLGDGIAEKEFERFGVPLEDALGQLEQTLARFLA